MINALTIDVEDYWSIFSRDWLHKNIEPTEAVVRNTEWFLQTLADHNVKATFFILGEVAKKFPSLVKKIAENDHEIGVHGFYHRQIFKLTEQKFSREVGDAKKLLEDIASVRVSGHRAPAFSLNSTTKWALEVLAQLAFEYDSSVFPMQGKRYGWPGFSRDICKINLPSGQNIIEVPMSTVTIFRKELPVGGGYIRHLPYWVTRWMIKRIQKNRPVIVYIHPHEIDTDMLAFETNHLSEQGKKAAIKFHRLQMRSRNTISRKLSNLLSEFSFTTIRQLIQTNMQILF